jgi:hypothetical protein
MNKVTYSSQQATPAVKVGQFYRRSDQAKPEDSGVSELYILAGFQLKYCLFCLNDGMNWTRPVDKIEDVFGDHPEEFELVANPFTITPNVDI